METKDDITINTTTNTTTGKRKLHYEKLDPITHIHRRTDMYIGNPLPAVHPPEWIVDEKDPVKMVRSDEPVYSDGLLRILIEPLSNMIDNAWRSREAGLKCSKFIIGLYDDHASFWNDGLGIPVQCHEQTVSDSGRSMYIPELIFGNLLTSTNYDDNEERLTSGRNGIGVKLSNVFSKRFEIEIYDAESRKIYSQAWNNHMRDMASPIIRSKSTPKSSYTKITFWPDFECFSKRSDDGKWGSTLPALLHRIAYDTAALTGVPVYFSRVVDSSPVRIQFKNLREYVQKCFPVQNNELLDGRIDLDKNQYIDFVIGTIDSPECMEMGYVNGIYNREGGVHVDAVSTDLFRQLHQRFTKARKDFPLTIKDLKSHFFIFVHAMLVNPTFTNQNKTRLVSPSPKMTLDSKIVQTIFSKWVTVKDRIAELLRQKEILSLRKSENKKRLQSTARIDGLDSANLAGTSRSHECTLILCEGLSAKTYAVAGIQIGWANKKGRDFFGIYPLRGKLLNCRNASVAVISQNKEITDLIQALNLRHGVDYRIPDNRKHLHYGRVLILTDSDVDGLHISSLILNAFHCLFPTLCDTEDPFLFWMMTPVAKIYPARSTGQIQTFYNDFEYQKALEDLAEAPKKVKYYKGLGTSSNHEVGETFGQKVVAFAWDPNASNSLVRAFSSSMTNERKKWMERHNPNGYKIPGEKYPVTEFIDQELVRYSIDDCQRSLPNVFDGLKQSHRKILYAVFKKGLVNKSMKVAQLAGYVAEVSNYHHGEQCLYDTVTKMAHDFVGSNNIPLLFRDGQFGSRTYMGKDAANARYIFTRLESLTRLLFPAVDDPLLHHTMDDGDLVEPDFYMPILPIILVNGCVAGIGTGWSCSVPCFHPLRILSAVRLWLKDAYHEIPEDTWTPWYRGFKGRIYESKAKTFITEGVLDAPGSWTPSSTDPDTSGVVNKKKKKSNPVNEYRIREIPVKESINRYKEFLEKLQEEKKIKNLRNYSTANEPYFVFEAAADIFHPTLDSMKLRSEISVSNMVLFVNHDGDSRIQKFETVNDIFQFFCEKRLDMYDKRKDFLLNQWETELCELRNRRRFLKEIMEETLHVFRIPEEEIIKQLETRRYDKLQDSYDYLLGTRIRQFSEAQVKHLEDQIDRMQNAITQLRESPPSRLWLDELDRFESAYKETYS